MSAIERVRIMPQTGYVPGYLALKALFARGLVIRAGLWCEFGVYQGETLRIAARERGDARLVGFDSFEGLPEEWTRPDTRDFRKGKFACEPPQVDGAELVVGLFQDTLPTFDDRSAPLTFLHVDCDIYASADTVLRWAQPKLRTGSVVLFDELLGYPGYEFHEWKALHEAHGRGLRWDWLLAAGESVAIRIVDRS